MLLLNNGPNDAKRCAVNLARCVWFFASEESAAAAADDDDDDFDDDVAPIVGH